jgi:hypothetical protein
MRDLHNNIKVSPLINPGAIINANGTTTSAIINRADYDSLELVVQAGAVTDGTMAFTVYHGDAANMSDEAACSAADLLGSAPSFDGSVAADDNATKRVGYKGPKQYVRIKGLQAGASTGGYFSAFAVQGHAKVAPVP